MSQLDINALDAASHIDASVSEVATGGTRRRRVAFGLLLAVGVLLILIVTLRTFVVTSYTVQGGSMEPTHGSGDRVWVNRLASPSVDDVVVVRVSGPVDAEIIKRIVGVAGDTVEISECRLIVNQAVVDESRSGSVRQPCGGDHGPVVVPADHVFLLGDNWSASRDSRQLGPIDASGVVGVVLGS